MINVLESLILVVSCLLSVLSPVFFSGPLGGEKIPPLSFEFPPQTITNFVCFLDILHIFSPPKSNFPSKTTSLEKKPVYPAMINVLESLIQVVSCLESLNL